MTSPWAILPIKGFARAKSRLSPALSTHQRADLARQLSLHVLDQLLGCADLHGVLVSTDSLDLLHLATSLGAHAIADPPDNPTLSTIIDAALDHLTNTLDASHALVFMADLPLLTTQDVSNLARLSLSADLVLAPDRAQQGTNALALPLPAPLKTCFGHPDSFPRHLQRAHELHLSTFTLQHPHLALDIDHPTDLHHWMST